MQREAHYWYSQRLGRDMGVAVYGHYGAPLLSFPTTGGDEWEYQQQGVIDAIAPFINAGRVKVFAVNTNHRDSFANRRAHPRHRSWMQACYDDYVVSEVVPFIRSHCRTWDIPIWTFGASLGAYHAVNTLLKHPDVFKRCFALSGVYDMKRFMDGEYDDNFYFNNPVDYMANLSDAWALHHLASCDIHLATGTGPWERPEEAYQLSAVLHARGVPHHLDDWGPQGGHDWPYWRHQLWEYLANA
jgi:esterase/lipase superfamily enzyme